MRTALFGAVGAVALAAAAFTSSAQAQCMWTGFNWSCATQAPAYGYPYAQPYGYWNYSEYYNAPEWNYKPGWLPSYAGPRPSSGAGH